MKPGIIVRQLNIKPRNVYTYLGRLRDRGKVFHDKSKGWKWVYKSSQIREKVDTPKGWGGPEVYQSQIESRLLAKQLLDYKAFHGLEVHLETIEVDTEIDTHLDNWIITLENRKLRIRSSHDPIPFSEANRLYGYIERILTELNYSGPKWLTHIELNNDLNGYKIDGAQRIEFKTFMGNIHRMYNKKVGKDEFLRVESVIHQKSGLVPLISGFALLGMARDFDNYLYILNRSDKRFRGVMSHLTHWESQAIQLENKISNSLDYFQSQTHDVQSGIDTVQLQVQKVQGVLKKVSIQSEVQQELDSERNRILRRQLDTQQQHLQETNLGNDKLDDLTELIRSIANDQLDWKMLRSEIKKEIISLLRKMDKSWTDISRILNYSSKSGPYNFTNRNFPEILKVDTSIDTVVNPIKLTDDAQETRIDQNVYGLSKKVDTHVNPQVNQVAAVLEKLGNAYSDQIIKSLPHILPGSVRRCLTNLKNNNDNVYILKKTIKGKYRVQYIWKSPKLE